MSPSYLGWRRATILCVAVASLAALGWFWRASVLPSNTIERVLLISIDTCRADYFGCYENPRESTPNIDQVAEEGFLFTHAVSPIPLTLPAHSSMLTGMNPPGHGVHDNLNYQLGEEKVTLAEILREQGFATGAIVSAFVLDARFGLHQGFDTYHDDFGDTLGVNIPPWDQRRGEQASRLAIDWLARHRDQKSFLFLHYFDPHVEYDPPEPFASRFATNLYEGEICYVDQCIGQVVGALKQLGIYDSTLLIITSDHGEMLGEHGEETHSYFIYRSAVRVPLIVKLPGFRDPSQIDEIVGIVDIVPTVCGLLNVEPSTTMQGVDLSGYFKGNSPTQTSRHYYLESLTPTKYDGCALRGVEGNRWKYIHTVRPELYDISNDPGESNNLIDNRSELALQLHEELKHLFAPAEAPADERQAMDPDVRRRLESLGYAGGRVAEPVSLQPTGTDAKDLLEFYLSDIQADRLIRGQQYDQAKTICRSMLDERPRSYETHMKMVHISTHQGEFTTALVHLDTAQQIEPGRFEVYEKRGAVLLMAGKLEESLASSEKALELITDNPQVHSNLGSALAQLGRLDEAERHFQESLRLNPQQVLVHNNLATLYLEQNKIDQATSHLQESSHLNKDQPDIWHRLAEIYARQGKLAHSTECLEAALELKPDWPALLNNLAWIRAASRDSQLRQHAQAVTLAEKACALTRHRDATLLDTLAVAYAATGQFSKATATAEKAVELAEAAGQSKLAEAIGTRLVLYRQQLPYVE